MMKSGLCGMVLILLIAVCKVAVTSGFAGLLTPMWLSLICTKLKSPPLPALRSAVLANARDTGMPPLKVQTKPVPAHAIALQESATINTVVVEVLQFLIDKILLLVRHLPSQFCNVLSQ